MGFTGWGAVYVVGLTVSGELLAAHAQAGPPVG